MLSSKYRKLFYYFVLNFGPQHPATHGVLRLIVKLRGDIIYKAIPLLGFLHRGTEKLFESKTLVQGLPLFDRLDYVSMMVNEHAFSLVIERLLNISVPLRAQYIRVIMLELTRLLNHLLAVGSCALDLGAMTVLLWFFEAREELLCFYESIAGARMHANFIRPGGVRNDISLDVMLKMFKFLQLFLKKLDDVEVLLSNNRIWKQRLVGVGVLKYKDALKFGLTGVMLRSTGIAWDLRKNFPYEVYNSLKFEIVLGSAGDCFDRYNMRMNEMRQSVVLILQCLDQIPLGSIRNNKINRNLSLRQLLKGSISSLIQHSKFCFESAALSTGSAYICVEAPKGELGVYLNMRGSSKPYRCHIRSPGFINIHTLDKLSRGCSIADIITIIGTLDVVFGEIDR